MREGKALDENFVKLEALDHLESVEVPDNNVSLKLRKTEKMKIKDRDKVLKKALKFLISKKF